MEAGGFDPHRPLPTTLCKTETKAVQNQHEALQNQTLTKIARALILTKLIHIQNKKITNFYTKSVLNACTKV